MRTTDERTYTLEGMLGIELAEGQLLAPGLAIAVSIGWAGAAFAASAERLRGRDLF